MKLESLARVSHLVAMREQWLRAMHYTPRLCLTENFSVNLADKTMVEAIVPAIQTDLQRRIDVIDTELVELGMTID